jgi:integrase/recombinase XerC
MTEKTLRTSDPRPPRLGDPEAEKFFQDLAGEDLSPVTVAGYRRDIEQFAAWYASQNKRALAVGDLTTLDLQSYRAQMVNVEGKKPATVNRRLEALKRLCRWAYEKGIHSEEIARQIKPVRVMKRMAPRGLERTELNALLRAAATSPREEAR